MTMLEDLGTYLDSNTSLTLGTDLFLGHLPDTPSVGTALYELVSSPPQYTLGAVTTPVWENPRVQVYVRHTAYASGRSLCQTIWLALQGIANETVNGVYYQRVQAIGSPEFLYLDDNNRPLFTCNLDVIKNVS